MNTNVPGSCRYVCMYLGRYPSQINIYRKRRQSAGKQEDEVSKARICRGLQFGSQLHVHMPRHSEDLLSLLGGPGGPQVAWACWGGLGKAGGMARPRDLLTFLRLVCVCVSFCLRATFPSTQSGGSHGLVPFITGVCIFVVKVTSSAKANLNARHNKVGGATSNVIRPPEGDTTYMYLHF